MPTRQSELCTAYSIKRAVSVRVVSVRGSRSICAVSAVLLCLAVTVMSVDAVVIHDDGWCTRVCNVVFVRTRTSCVVPHTMPHHAELHTSGTSMIEPHLRCQMWSASRRDGRTTMAVAKRPYSILSKCGPLANAITAAHVRTGSVRQPKYLFVYDQSGFTTHRPCAASLWMITVQKWMGGCHAVPGNGGSIRESTGNACDFPVR